MITDLVKTHKDVDQLNANRKPDLIECKRCDD